MEFHAADDIQFRVSVFYGLRAPRPTLKWVLSLLLYINLLFAGVVGALTHADAPQRGNAPHSTPFNMRLSRFTINRHIKLFFVGAISRALANPLVTKNAIYATTNATKLFYD
jgi:hypothetical protein